MQMSMTNDDIKSHLRILNGFRETTNDFVELFTVNAAHCSCYSLLSQGSVWAVETKSSVPVMPARQWAIYIITNASHVARAVRPIILLPLGYSYHKYYTVFRKKTPTHIFFHISMNYLWI